MEVDNKVLIIVVILIGVVLLSNNFDFTGAFTKKEIPLVVEEEPAEGLIGEVNLGSSFIESIGDNNGYLKTYEGLKVETSLTAQEDDYQTGVVLEVGKDSIKYYLNTYGKIIGETFNLLGNKIKILDVGGWYGNSLEIETQGRIMSVKDGDAFIDESLDDPDWVWDLSGLNTNNPAINIENDFIWNDDSDNPVKVGECIYLPNDYAKICLDGLTVGYDEYDTYTIEYEDSADLSDTFLRGYNEKAIHISGTSVISSVETADGNIKLLKDIWITGDGSVYYKDSENRIRYFKPISLYDQGIGIIGDLQLNAILQEGGEEINVIIRSPNQETLDAKFSVVNGEIYALGDTKSYEEPSELNWAWSQYYKNFQNIGTKDEDHRTAYGIIIRDPKSHGASDEVVLDIPRRQVKAEVSISFGGVPQSGDEKVTYKGVLDMLNNCYHVMLLQKEVQEIPNGVTCNKLCEDNDDICILGYRKMSKDTDPNVWSQKTGTVPCDVLNGPMATDYIDCVCCSSP